MSPDAKILDYGCGYGRLTRLLSALGYSNVNGYDTSAKMIARGNSESPDLDLRLSASGFVPGFEDQFDAAIVCGVLSSLPADSSIRVNPGTTWCT